VVSSSSVLSLMYWSMSPSSCCGQRIERLPAGEARKSAFAFRRVQRIAARDPFPEFPQPPQKRRIAAFTRVMENLRFALSG